VIGSRAGPIEGENLHDDNRESREPPMKIGYARVSTDEQNPAMQLDALRAAGCERLFEDLASGAKESRPGLDEALAFARKGDELVVWRLDRVGRSLPHLVKFITHLREAGIGFRSLTENIETETPGGRLVMHIFAALAEFERDLIRERTRSGLAAARARGRSGGRKPLAAAKLKALRAMWAEGTMTAGEIAAQLDIGRRTVFKYVKDLPGGKQ
jgi:DNA invertase Pin-like site-specific DNA recombinase